MLRCHRAARGAFTLVELLVVIGIIALLVSILLPAFSRAREQALTIKCQANLRSILQACYQYSSDNKGIVVPAGTAKDGWWSNILVEYNYIPAETATDAEVTAGRGPMINSILFCPSGNMEFFPPSLNGNTTVPADRQDVRGAMGWRFQNPGSLLWVDCWYGINANEGSSTTAGTPCRRQQSASDAYIKLNMIRNPTEMVMFFDGIIYHHMIYNASRINARHCNRTQTNLAFFDGHVEMWRAADLPGGLTPSVTDYTVASLRANYGHQSLKWYLEQ